ncbi:MAG TPA: Rad52/Rad22 family DNA repair protein [Terriglobales bacterium]|nr:Rad52/Rad22 family DNA repair protein [Terriglobales bacterium]
MAATNGQAKNRLSEIEGAQASAPPVKPAVPKAAICRTTAKMRGAVAELEVPFEAGLIEWRIMKFEREGSKRKGLLMPYADQRAYTDRLNALFTPAGWSRRYSVHTSANFERSRDGKMVAKVFVTCELKVLGLGAHSATGEEWTDDENAGTSAEAQAFKRACSCFGLGRYLYSFGGVWVELDERNRAKEVPVLNHWATPQGWRAGLRPGGQERGYELDHRVELASSEPTTARDKELDPLQRRDLVEQIQAMAEPLGRRLYRGLLKSGAMVWKPEDVREMSLLEKVLVDMQAAQRALDRLRGVVEEGGAESLSRVLYSFALRSLGEVTTLERLDAIVAAAEAEAEASRSQS